jgi:hypothetical protein
MNKSRLVIALGLVLALGASSVAFGTGATDNQAFVDGKLKKTTLPKKKYVKNQLFLGVRTETNAPLGTQSNPAVENISFGKNIKFDLKAGAECSTLPPSGSTAQQARDACPKKSYLGSGEAELIQPNGQRITDVVVSVFKGPQSNGIQLHTASPTLQAAAPTINGSIQKSNAGSAYGQALVVPAVPETGSLMITKFNATIEKSTGVVLTRCKSKKIPYLRKVTYQDGSTETAELTQKCKRKS